MTSATHSELIKTLTTRAKRLYNTNDIPYKWDDVIKLIETDPEVFYACLRRATSNDYKLPVGVPKSYRLWITCNMIDGYTKRNDCYFCGKVMKREEFLAGNVHLEHFDPRSKGGEHIQGNITLACRTCNLLKGDLTDADFDLILNNPETFRSVHPTRSSRRFQQLLEFAEVAAPRYKGLSWIAERFGVSSQNCRRVWDELRSAYREKWDIQ